MRVATSAVFKFFASHGRTSFLTFEIQLSSKEGIHVTTKATEKFSSS